MQHKKEKIIKGTKIVIFDNQFNKGMSKFKKMVQNEKIIQDYMKHEFYEKPTQIKKRKKAAARARWLKKVNSEQLSNKRFY